MSVGLTEADMDGTPNGLVENFNLALRIKDEAGVKSCDLTSLACSGPPPLRVDLSNCCLTSWPSQVFSGAWSRVVEIRAHKNQVWKAIYTWEKLY